MRTGQKKRWSGFLEFDKLQSRHHPKSLSKHWKWTFAVLLSAVCHNQGQHNVSQYYHMFVVSTNTTPFRVTRH